MCAAAAIGDEEDLDEGEVTVALQAEQQTSRTGQLVGLDVAKAFDGHGTFQGNITKWDARNGWYQIVYADGDSEEVREDEARALLVDVVADGLIDKTANKEVSATQNGDGEP
jgi:hypothetical protein